MISLLAAACAALAACPVQKTPVALIRDDGLPLNTIEERLLAPGDNAEAVRELQDKGYVILDVQGWAKVVIAPNAPPLDRLNLMTEFGKGLPLGTALRWGDLKDSVKKSLWSAISRGPATLESQDSDARILLFAYSSLAGDVRGKRFSDGMELTSGDTLSQLSPALTANPFSEGGASRPMAKGMSLRLDHNSEGATYGPELHQVALEQYAKLVSDLRAQAERSRVGLEAALLKANPDLADLPAQGTPFEQLPAGMRARARQTFLNSSAIYGIAAEEAATVWDSSTFVSRGTMIHVAFASVREGSRATLFVLPLVRLK